MRCGQEGWDELDMADMTPADQDQLWEMVASGDVEGANSLVADVFDFELEDVCDVDIIAEPCELRQNWSCYRVWMKECKR